MIWKIIKNNWIKIKIKKKWIEILKKMLIKNLKKMNENLKKMLTLNKKFEKIY